VPQLLQNRSVSLRRAAHFVTALITTVITSAAAALTALTDGP
jgi:hypothetical protein